MQSVAQSWLVYRITGSVALLGFIGFAGQFPVFLLTAFGGALADKYNRQRILMAMQTASMILALTLAFLTLSGYVEVRHLFIIAPLSGVVNAFDIPTRQSLVVDMVGKEDLPNNSAIFLQQMTGALFRLCLMEK